MFAFRVWNASLVGSDASHGCVAVVGETRWKLPERYHVKANKKTAFEDWFGKAYQGEVMKFAEATLFRVGGKIRDGVRQGRADARFVRGTWLGKTAESHEHLFARVPDSSQKRADFVGSLQAPWSRLAGRPAGRPRKTAPQAPSVPTPPMAEESERPSEDASERRSAKAQDLNLPTVPHVIRVPRAADTENEPSSSSSRPKMAGTTVPKVHVELRAVRYNRQIGGADNSP